MKVIDTLFHLLSYLTNIAAAAGLIFLTAALSRDRRHIEMWLCICGMVLSAALLAAAVVLFCSWFDSKMESSVYMYLAGTYPLLQIAKYLTIYQSLRLLAERGGVLGVSLGDRVRRV